MSVCLVLFSLFSFVLRSLAILPASMVLDIVEGQRRRREEEGSHGSTFAFKKQGDCLSSLGSAAPERSSTVHESHIGQTGLYTAQRSDVDSPANFMTSQLAL